MTRGPECGDERFGHNESSVQRAINSLIRRAGACETEEELARTCLAVAEELTGDRFGVIDEPDQDGESSQPKRRHRRASTAELQRVNEALKESEQLYRTLIEASPDAIVLTDLTGRIIKANERAATLFGYPDAGALNDVEVLQLMAPCDRERGAAAMARVQREDGSTFVAEAAAAVLPRPDDQPGGFVTIFRDVTEELEIQTRLAQSDRLISVGMLAAGVAHEINNPLTYVLYNVETLVQDLPLVAEALSWCRSYIARKLGPATAAHVLGKVGEMLDQGLSDDLLDSATEAAEGARRVRKIVRDLKMFSRVDDDSFSPVPLNLVLESAINMSYGEIKRRARLVKDLGEVPDVFCSEGRLCQVFLNLLVNAAQAIKAGDISLNEIRVRTWAEGDRVFAEVRDTGQGIATEHKERLFDPFFTTKPAGEGSGLGLAICQSIIKEYGGRIEVHSTPGEGSRFVVQLPLSPVLVGAMDSAPVLPPGDEELAPRGRVLVVDDEPSICAALRRALKREHDVVEATSGSAARKILEQDTSFDVILCDVIMPDLSGVELHDWLQERAPDLARRIVFVTGGGHSQEYRDYFNKIGHIMIAKPFSPDEINEAVRRVMAGED